MVTASLREHTPQCARYLFSGIIPVGGFPFVDFPVGLPSLFVVIFSLETAFAFSSFLLAAKAGFLAAILA